MTAHCRITTIEYKDVETANNLGKEYVDELMPKFKEIGATRLLAVRTGPTSIAFVSGYSDKANAAAAASGLRAESPYVVAPPVTVEGDVIGELTGG